MRTFAKMATGRYDARLCAINSEPAAVATVTSTTRAKRVRKAWPLAMIRFVAGFRNIPLPPASLDIKRSKNRNEVRTDQRTAHHGG